MRLKVWGTGSDRKQDAAMLVPFWSITVVFYQRHICLQYLHMWLQLAQETNSLLVERFGLPFTPTEHQFQSSAGKTPGK
jgi:hypothetical protein